jgi:outer membrane protein assembly factor BamB
MMTVVCETRLTLIFLAALLMAVPASAGDRPQLGQIHTRNMISDEKGLPDRADPATGKNVKWTANLGTQTWTSGVIVANKRIFVGTNNDRPRDPRHKGDRGVLMCFNEADGKFLWQLVVPKLSEDRYKDWPRIGLCSPPTVEGDRVYVVTNRAQVVCLDIDGLANGNDGPFKDEGKVMTPPGSPAMDVGRLDADIIWIHDMHRGGKGEIWPHDGVHVSIFIDGKYLYFNTSNGLDNTHRRVRCPDGPSLMVMDKETGKVVARDYEGIGPMIFHATWSGPSLGVVNGRKMVFFGGGDGLMYAFEALGDTPPADGKLKRVWKFDCDPTAPKKNIHKYRRNREVSPSIIKSSPVFHEGRIYVTATGDIWWGKRKSWLKCIDASKTGDVTKTAEVWSAELNSHCCSTPSIKDGLVYISDCGSTIHCLELKTGKTVWTHDTGGSVWGSTLVADGKVYAGTRRGNFWILAAGREKKVLAEVDLDSSIHNVPTAANGVLYVATMKKLYALAKEKK